MWLTKWAGFTSIKQYRKTFTIKQLYRNFFRSDTSNFTKNAVCSTVERTSGLIERNFEPRGSYNVDMKIPKFIRPLNVPFNVTILYSGYFLLSKTGEIPRRVIKTLIPIISPLLAKDKPTNRYIESSLIDARNLQVKWVSGKAVWCS